MVLRGKGDKMKISFRVWLLAVCLALAFIAIVNGSTSYRLLAGLIVLLVPVGISYTNSKIGKVVVTIILLLSLFSVVYLSAQEGVVIKSVDKNSTAFVEGIRSGMVIKAIGGQEIKSIADYSREISKVFPAEKEIKLVITTEKQEFILFTNETPKITVENIGRTNIKTGLDLSGGARALVAPERKLSSSEMSDLISVTSNRLNVFGLSDITVRSVSDLEGNNFMLIEVAGATPSDLKELVGKQGKFEARIGNSTNASNVVFEGGKGDISDVCRNRAECAGISGCFPMEGGGEVCNFRFAIYLTEEAAKRHANITGSIPLDETGKYLSEKLYLYVDDVEVDSLMIGADLKGRVTTEISIQGSGKGNTREEAFNDAKASMSKLQTILITGSLPYKLNIVKLDTISPVLGEAFSANILKLGLIVFAIICIVLFAKYRKIKITLAVILTVISEALLTLAVASVIRWNLDAPSIAGIIAGMGTGVNDQIIIIDESISEESAGLKERIKRALFIILGAFFTIVAAMLPLFWAGTGLLRGFALTTIIGVSVGILITRPAFADIIKKISE
jgi:preprotein translocase subunit SecD